MQTMIMRRAHECSHVRKRKYKGMEEAVATEIFTLEMTFFACGAISTIDRDMLFV